MTDYKVAGRLQYLCNKYGDFKVAKSWKDTKGETHWSKHRSVMQCWETEEGIRWLNQVSHRQILPCETVIDLDDNPSEQLLNTICDLLDSWNEKYAAYHTGSRGYHIHVLFKRLALQDMNKIDREKVRELFIRSVTGDLAKMNEVMIALEDVPHWKSGVVKKMVRSSKGWEGF